MKLSRQDTMGLMVLAFAVIVGLTVRIAGALDKKTIEHDEAVAYLTATGHLGIYMVTQIHGTEQSLAGHWVKASRWKQFLNLDSKFCFGQIGNDVATHYVHPPFYFWLLHLWVIWFGVNSLAGLSLNFVIFLLTVFTLFRLGQYVFGNILEASLGALLWALSPATIVTSLMARNWELLTLLTVLFALLIIQYVDGQAKPRKIDLVLLAIVACVGSLTHYQFLLIVLPAGVLLGLFKLASKESERLLSFLASIFLGCLLALFMHLDFTNSFLISQKYAWERFSFREVPFRILIWLACLASFFTAILQRITDGGLLFEPTHSPPLNFYGIVSVLSYDDLAVAILVALVLIAIGWSICLHRRPTKNLEVFGSLWKSPTGSVLWFGIYLVVSVTVEYFAFFLQREAMRERYLSMFWPFAALTLVLVVRHSGKTVLFSIVLTGLFLFVGVNQALHFRWLNEKLEDPKLLFEKAPSLVIDTFIEGKLLPIVWHLPDETMVFVASQKYLLEHREQWLNGLRDGSIIVSVLGYGARQENQEQIVRIAVARCRVSDLHVPIWKWTTLFRIDSCDRTNDVEKNSR